jgi:hypothetical protein
VSARPFSVAFRRFGSASEPEGEYFTPLIAEVTPSCGPKVLDGELIPQTRHYSKVGRTAWIVLQLVPKFHNVIVDTAAARIAISVAADFFRPHPLRLVVRRAIITPHPQPIPPVPNSVPMRTSRLLGLGVWARYTVPSRATSVVGWPASPARR